MDKDNETVEETTTEQTTETQETTEETSFLDMTDEDIANMSEPPEVEASAEESTEDEDKDETGSDTSEDAGDSESTSQIDDEGVADSDNDSSEESDDGASDDSGTEELGDETQDAESSEDSDNKDTEDDSTELSQAEKDMKKLLSPFKANGREIQVESVDDAITLMQMGANYNRKMASLKPNLKIIKTLENEGLLDEGKLANLIDLSKKNPAAIKQLIKDSGIDPLDIDVKEDTGYTPETYNVDDTEVELDLVLDDLKSTPKFNETMNIINNKFDAASKKVLVESPAIIRVLNEHVELGIYDKIANVVERERMLGRLTGLNDLQAYKQVSDAINAKGGIRQEDGTSTSEKTDKQTTATTKQDENKTKARKKSAAVTKSAPGNKKKDKTNPLSISDEDFENMPMSKYM